MRYHLAAGVLTIVCTLSSRVLAHDIALSNFDMHQIPGITFSTTTTAHRTTQPPLSGCEGQTRSSLEALFNGLISKLPANERVRARIKFSNRLRLWTKKCEPQTIRTSTGTIQTGSLSDLNTQDFSIINPTALHTLSNGEKQTMKERTKLYAAVVTQQINDMISRGVLTSKDKSNILGKVAFQYVTNCNQLDGKTSIKQWFNSQNVFLRNELTQISLNINMCFTGFFAKEVENTFTQIITHELGHYYRYFYDYNTATFTNYCRTKGVKKAVCTEKSFVSDYAMSAPEEDYAETFAYRYLNKAVPGGDTIIDIKKSYFVKRFTK